MFLIHRRYSLAANVSYIQSVQIDSYHATQYENAYFTRSKNFQKNYAIKNANKF